jgi:hypothetical protein
MPYRSDYEAVRSRCQTLQHELEAVEGRARDLEALRSRAASLRAELAAARRLLESLESKRALPMWDDLRVAAPCKADWSKMSGDERVRFCGECGKNVYNLSRMTREEGEQLVREKEGRLCVRFYRRPDGTLLTSDCPVGLRRARFRKTAIAGVIGLGLFAVGTVWAASVTMGAPPSPIVGKIQATMGAPAVPSR